MINEPKYITVGELMTALSKLNPNAHVEIAGEYYGCPLESDDVQVDEEGNLVISYYTSYKKLLVEVENNDKNCN